MLNRINPDFIQRFKHASAAEIAYRIRKKAFALKVKRALRQNKNPLVVPSVDHNMLASLRLPEISVHFQNTTLKNVTEFLDAHAHINAEELQEFQNRHRNHFSDDIAVHPSDPDIRTVWESARLQKAALLLLAAPPSELMRKEGLTIVTNWIRNNPFLRGPHYMSAMEGGLRIPVFFYGLKAGINLNTEEQNTILRAIFEHAWWIERNLSLYASLGNHTVCECMGLVFAGAVFGNTPSGKKWLHTACQLLTQELRHQILPDGGPAEQSTAYHRFVLDLYWLTKDFLEKNHLYDCMSWQARLLKGEQFLGALQIQDHVYPMIGDSDDGQAVAFGAAPLRGNAGRSMAPVITFPEAGYTVMRGVNGTLLTFDHGPLGMPPLCNHGHADALAVTLAINGHALLVDPGTYRYNNVPAWREYFKGTRAHNTVTVDGEDQAVQVTGFIWSKPYQAVLNTIQSGSGWILMQGQHDGYSRCKDSVIHVRHIFIEDETRLLIRDSFKGRGVHEFEINWHLHPKAVLTRIDGWLAVNVAGISSFIRLLEGDFELLHGSENPLRGWFSPAYGVKLPSPTLTHKTCKKTPEAVFTTIIAVNTPCDADYLTERFRYIENQTANS